MSKIFISYATADSSFVKCLADELKVANADVWLDSVDINVGDDIPQAIDRGLRECELFLIVLSPASVASRWVKNELSYAQMSEKRIIPVLFADCEVPPLLFATKYADLRDHETASIRRFAQSLVGTELRLETPTAKDRLIGRLLGCPIAPPVRPIDIPARLWQLYSEHFEGSSLVRQFVATVMGLRKQANPEGFTDRQILVSAGELPPIQPAEEFWAVLFTIAGRKSRRTVEAILVAESAPNPLLQSADDRVMLDRFIRQLRHPA